MTLTVLDLNVFRLDRHQLAAHNDVHGNSHPFVKPLCFFDRRFHCLFSLVSVDQPMGQRILFFGFVIR